MSQFEKSEVMIKYAELMMPIEKEAADVADYTQEIVSGVGIGLATDLAIGAAIVGAKAALLPGVGIAGAGAFVSGTPALALLGGPVGIALGLVAAAGYAIYELSKLTDDNIDDLVSRLDALDTGDQEATNTVQGWINALNKYKPILSAAAPITNDTKKKAAYNKRRLDALTALVSDLKTMQSLWPQLAARLTDWGWDDSQAKTALDKTLVAMEQQKQRIVSVINAKAVEERNNLINQVYEKYGPAVKRMQENMGKLTQMYGKPPEPENDMEKRGMALLDQLANKKITSLQVVGDNMSGFTALSQVLEKAIKQPAKSAKFYAPISKRALLLGNGTSVTVDPGKATRAPGKQKGTGQKGKARLSKDPNVEALQTMVNELNARYKTPQVSQVTVDGFYGKNTADAVRRLLVQAPEINSQLEQQGVTSYNSGDHRLMAKNPKNYATIKQVLGRFTQGTLPTGSGPRGISTRAPGRQQPAQPAQRAGVPESKENMSPTEINRALRLLKVTDPETGKQEAAFNWLLKNYKDASPAQVADKVFRGNREEMPEYKTWNGKALVNWVLTMQGKPTRSKSYKRDSGPAPKPDRAGLKESAEQSMYVRFRSPNTGNPTNMRDWLSGHGGYRKESLRIRILNSAIESGARSAQDVIDYVNQVGGALFR